MPPRLQLPFQRCLRCPRPLSTFRPMVPLAGPSTLPSPSRSFSGFASLPRRSPLTARSFLKSFSSYSQLQPATLPRSMPKWLYGCSALVFGILVIGGLTRLTESGLSITEWQPITGIRPPLTEEEWDVEWEKYRISPEGVLMNANIERSEFKRIFYMEWAHRIAGRVLGVAFIVPAVYYVSRYRLPRLIPLKLLGIGVGIGLQGVIGWYMVKSGLEQEIIDTKGVPRVSQYRLAAHLSAALLLYVGMLHTALSLKNDTRLSADRLNFLNAPATARFRILARVAGAMVFFTAVSGAFVAGLDAGLVYNEFPTMGGRIVPPKEELMDPRYAHDPSGRDTWWRNMLENPVTAQFDHRAFATSTFLVLLSLPLLARRRVLPRSIRRLADATAAAAVVQVTLGITTLLYLVPVPLAATHQAGSVVLLTCLTALVASLRRPNAALRLMRR